MGPGHKRTRYALVQVDVSGFVSFFLFFMGGVCWGCGGVTDLVDWPV
jgi:hypothetical protein